jgi:hypothetical protein
MLILDNGIRVMLDHVTWYSLREDPRPERTRWILQFGYAGGDKTFVAFTDEAKARKALADADEVMTAWISQ